MAGYAGRESCSQGKQVNERLLVVLQHNPQLPLAPHLSLAAVPPCCSCCSCCRVAFQEGEEAAWEDLEHIYVPAANEGRLPLRVYAFVALPTW